MPVNNPIEAVLAELQSLVTFGAIFMIVSDQMRIQGINSPVIMFLVSICVHFANIIWQYIEEGRTRNDMMTFNQLARVIIDAIVLTGALLLATILLKMERVEIRNGNELSKELDKFAVNPSPVNITTSLLIHIVVYATGRMIINFLLLLLNLIN